MDWDRSKQKYFILRRGNPWKVISIDGEREIAKFPAYNYDKKLTEAICFAESDEKVRELLQGVVQLGVDARSGT
jgi:hypothetical protein